MTGFGRDKKFGGHIFFIVEGFAGVNTIENVYLLFFIGKKR